MDKAFPLYQADNTLDEYYALKPDLTDTQQLLLSALYRARRETPNLQHISVVEFERQAANIPLELDICVHILQKLDDEYVSLEAEKMKRNRK